MSRFPLFLRDYLWWRPRGGLSNTLIFAPILAFLCLMLWLGAPATRVLCLALGLLLIMMSFLASSQIGFAASSEAFALMPRRPRALRLSLMGLVFCTLASGLAFAGMTGHWQIGGLVACAFSIPVLLLSSTSQAGFAGLRPARFLLNLIGVGSVILLTALTGWLLKRFPDLPGALLMLPAASGVILLLAWRLHSLERWRSASFTSHSLPGWLAMSPHAWTITFTQIFLAGLIFGRNPFGLYLLVSLLPFQSLAILQPRQIRDVMSRHWLAGMPRSALWRPALRSIIQLVAVNLVLLLVSLEAFKHLPQARLESLAAGQIALACGMLPLALWQLVQITCTRREQDAGWLGFQTIELPGYGPLRSTRTLLRLLDRGRNAWFGALAFPLCWVACSAYFAWRSEGQTGRFALCLLPFALAACLAALPLLYRNLRRMDL